MKGVYCLVIELSGGLDISVGALGIIGFGEGFYVYVGSALNSLESRVGRHLRREKKRFWHIDYLLEHAGVVDVVCAETSERVECAIAEGISRVLVPVKGFGCSDCGCGSHLFHSSSLVEAQAAVEAAFTGVGLIPRKYFI